MKRIRISIIRVFAFAALQSCLFLGGCSMLAEQTSAPSQLPLYASKCGACHRLIGPDEHDEATWKHYVEKYGKKLTDDEKQEILNYLTHVSDQTK